MRAYQKVRNVCFSGNFAHALNERSINDKTYCLTTPETEKDMLHAERLSLVLYVMLSLQVD